MFMSLYFLSVFEIGRIRKRILKTTWSRLYNSISGIKTNRHEHTFISKKRSITNKINIEKNLIVIFWGEGGWGITIFGNWV